MKNRLLAASLLALSGATALGGCAYPEPTVVPAVSPTVGPERVVTYPEGRYELRGDGTVASPYYWVWIPRGAAPPSPPPPPRRPPTQ